MAPEIVYEENFEKNKATEAIKQSESITTGEKCLSLVDSSLEIVQDVQNSVLKEKEVSFDPDIETFRKKIGLTTRDDQTYPELQEIAYTSLGSKKFKCTELRVLIIMITKTNLFKMTFFENSSISRSYKDPIQSAQKLATRLIFWSIFGPNT